ncbi:1868_t:CDS:1, partial [Paraglomus occultum]
MVEVGLQMQHAVYNEEPLPIDKSKFFKLSNEGANDAEDSELADDGEPVDDGFINNNEPITISDEPITTNELASGDGPTNSKAKRRLSMTPTLEILFSNIHCILDLEDVQ